MSDSDSWDEGTPLSSLQALERLLDSAGLAPRFRRQENTAGVLEVVASETGVDELHQHVLHNRPVVIRGAILKWQPVLLWDDDYLLQAGSEARVPVRHNDSSAGAVGNPARDGIYRVEEVEWGKLLSSLQVAEQSGSPALMYAAQLRLRTLLPALFRDTRPPPVWLAALGPPWRNAPSAYFGCGSHTPLHFDLLDNLLCMVRGRKRVKLWHPAHGPQLYPKGGGEALFSRVDLDNVDHKEFPLFQEAARFSIDVEVKAGDALYLPCGWWHAVSTAPGERSISISFWAQQPEGKAWERDVDGTEHDNSKSTEACLTR